MISLTVIVTVLSTTMSCCSKRKLERKHLAEIEGFHRTISEQGEIIRYNKMMLDSLSSLPPKVDTLIKHTQIIIDNTDSLVRINNEMLIKLRLIKFDTDTIKSILRQ